ncbi:prolyl oligopeptidase family serine peptidase [Pseudoalteromonas shioyasakiensis]|uniref:alpha/beta hydrolase family protein n=1 Tax=Pseudoalteromonas shioyasakiensis TaxID=1190813 RepID=UPI00211781E4|nr:prolyl oligopeptidase family serine peptidase [Pseudoalteromonas shioyasakiensis]MCQ8879928.1 prolyl oligopeptidase family serine peptidase [Pseudoalteromonas shioyasakiensis]
MNAQLSILSLALVASLGSATASAKDALQFKDVFDFKSAKGTQLSEDGHILSFSAAPYRGDATGQVYNLTSNKLIAEVPRGTKPTINKAANWVVFTQVPTLLEKETTKKKDTLKNNLILVNTLSGEQQQFDDVKDYKLSDDGNWLAYRLNKKADKEDDLSSADSDKKSEIKPDKKDKAFDLVVVNLNNKTSHTISQVLSYAISSDATQLLASQIDNDGTDNQVTLLELNNDFTSSALIDEPGVVVNKIAWHPTQNIAAFTLGNYVNDDVRRRDYQLKLYKNEQLTDIPSANKNWQIGKTAKLEWSEDGERLYFDNRPKLAAKVKAKEYSDEASLYDYDTIRDQKGLNVWHNNDAEIKPREEQQWNKANKNRHYKSVYFLSTNKSVQLTTPEVPEVALNTKRDALLGYSNQAYLERIMYGGFFADYYAVDVKTGAHKAIIKDYPFRPSLSPNGAFAAYFNDSHVQLKDLANNKVSTLTKAIQATFADDKHDYPSAQPGYGFAGWLNDSSQVLVYSKYDIWAFDVTTQQGTRLTNGKPSNTQYRAIKLDKDQVGFNKGQTLLVSATNLKDKQTEVAKLNLADNAITKVLTGNKRFDVIKKAKHANKYLFTEQTYQQFPDIYQTDFSFNKPVKVTNLNPQVANFAWGQEPELISYKGFDGEDLQGVLIKPAGYKKGDKVPVVVYFYRYMSQRMYDFPKMELNHRPNFPMFTSNGYAIFLPDIRFEIGHPGKSSTQTMVNATQKLIDLGIADPDKIGLQGHSWAGYQSAFMITQTDMFKAVVSGAPVSNMTSAYSGIRLKSGLARQFQYETGQSRIGKTLFEAPELYIENSPVFFADKVNTPILIMFGDKDDAVPWHEGVQYYLALRRAGKDATFLQYEGEPHHLKKFPNQVDFSIRMMQYFDHYLKGKPAAKWMTEGEAFIEE